MLGRCFQTIGIFQFLRHVNYQLNYLSHISSSHIIPHATKTLRRDASDSRNTFTFQPFHCINELLLHILQSLICRQLHESFIWNAHIYRHTPDTPVKPNGIHPFLYHISLEKCRNGCSNIQWRWLCAPKV